MWPNPQFSYMGERVKLTNSILLIRTCSDSSICSENVYSSSSENSQDQGQHFVADVDVTNKVYLAEIVAQR